MDAFQTLQVLALARSQRAGRTVGRLSFNLEAQNRVNSSQPPLA